MNNYFKDKKVLVTGASGFIGLNMVFRLQELEAKVLGTYNQHLIVGSELNNELAYADLTIKSNCEALLEIGCSEFDSAFDIVIHCAAVTHGAKFMNENPAALVTDNTVMNTYLLDAAHKAGVKKFVFISSGAVYPNRKMFDEYKYSEDDIYGEPPDCYFGVAHMKRYGEKLCEFYSTKVKNPMQCLIVRPSNVYGPYDDFNPDTSHVMAALIKKYCDKQDPFEVWGDGKDVRDFIYVDDFVNDVLALTEKVDKFDIFNVGYGYGFSVNQILRIFLKVKDIKYLKGKPSTIKKRLLDIGKIDKFLGKRNSTCLLDGINKIVEWYKENKL